MTKLLGWFLVVSLAGGVTPAVASDSQIERATLTGLTPISVVVEELPAIAEKSGLTTASIQADVERRLRQAGITLSPDADAYLYVHVTIAETASDDRTEVGQIADRFREGKRNAVLVLFSSAGRGAIHVTLTDDLVGAGRRAGDLVNRIAALSGGKGGGRPHFASAGAGDPTKLPAARAATPELVSAWLGEGGHPGGGNGG